MIMGVWQRRDGEELVRGYKVRELEEAQMSYRCQLP